jgi:hypothetical protein
LTDGAGDAGDFGVASGRACPFDAATAGNGVALPFDGSIRADSFPAVSESDTSKVPSPEA